MMNYTLGDGGLVIPFGSMLEHAPLGTVEGLPLLVNLKTVARNVAEAYDFKTGSEMDYQNTAKQMLKETIENLVMELAQRAKIRVAFYNIDYSRIMTHGVASRYEPKTDKQKEKLKRVELLYPELDQYVTVKFPANKVEPFSQIADEPTLILTHYAQDLLEHHRFRSLKLLESHSGAIKGPNQFNSKLKLDSKLKKIVPFNSFTQAIYGDDTVYNPADIKLRQAVTKAFTAFGINPTTPFNRVSFIIRNKEPMLAGVVRGLLI